MIEKKSAFQLIIVICVFVLGFILLICFFDFSASDLIKEILLASVTGCAFSLPGVAFYLKINGDRCKQERRKVLEQLEEILADGCVLCGEIIQPVGLLSTPANVVHIRNIYYDISRISNENYVENAHCYDELRTCLERILQEAGSSANNSAEDVSKQIASCLKLIGDILKRDPYKFP